MKNNRKWIQKGISIILCLLLVTAVGHSLFAVKIIDVPNEIEIIQTNTRTVTLKRKISDDMYAIIYVDTPSIGRDDVNYVDRYMKYSTTSTYTLYQNDKIIVTDEDMDCISVRFGLNIYQEDELYDGDIRVIEDVSYFDENDKEHWFSYKKSTRITFEGKNENRKGLITRTKDMIPDFVSKIKLGMDRLGNWIYKTRKKNLQ